MSSEPAPPNIPSVETGTPPREWSESVLASSTAKDTPAGFSEIPGRVDNPNMVTEESPEEVRQPEVRAQYGEEPQQSRMGDPSTVSATTMQTDKQFVPEKYIRDTAVSYLSSREYKEEPQVSLPSTELKGAQPSEHIGGVGALPGNLSESSVALLPDERQERAQERRPSSPRRRRDTIKATTAGGSDEPREFEKEEEARVPQDVTPPKSEPTTSQPSDVSPGRMETRPTETVKEGIAAKSGAEVESREGKKQMQGQEGLQDQGKAADVEAGTTPSTEELVKKKKDSEEHNLATEGLGPRKVQSQDIQEGGKEERNPPTQKVEEGYSGEYHPAQLHPPPPGASVAEYQASGGVQQGGQDLPVVAGKRASVGAEKKPGLMTIVKGEMKVLAGKMSGDKHKVEEGRRIVHGEA